MADNSRIQLIYASKNDTSFDCDLCNRKFNKMSYYKLHYLKVHDKCLIEMPVKNKKNTVKLKTTSLVENKSKTATKFGKRNKTTVKTEKAEINEDTTESKHEMCLTDEAETCNVKKGDTKAKYEKTATKVEEMKIMSVKVEKADNVSEHTIENVKERNIKTEAEIFNVKKKVKKDIYNCEGCKATFNSFFDLDKHSLSHEPKNTFVKDKPIVKPIVCDVCGENFTIKSAYTNHKLLHTLKCGRCGELFNSLELNFMNTHVCVGEVHDIMSKCEVCGKQYNNCKNFKAHRRIKHGLYNQPYLVIKHNYNM